MPEASPSLRQRTVKRGLDLAVAATALLITSPVLVIAVALATIDCRAFGIFSQQRVGRHGQLFRVYKIRTMRDSPELLTHVTSASDPRITKTGRFFRSLKIDELPQLVNVLRGEMSLVGPRPDVAGFADLLEGADLAVLTVRPGITGPASIAYRHEEVLLAAADDPERYNAEVIWPDKVRINREYVENYSLGRDIRLLAETMLSVARRGDGRQASRPS